MLKECVFSTCSQLTLRAYTNITAEISQEVRGEGELLGMHDVIIEPPL